VLEYTESGEGRPLVFVHGLVLHGGFWRKLVPLLEDSYRCIVPTLPLGSHSKAQPPDADLTPTGIADLLADFIAELGLDDVVLVGNDTGGAICQILVTRRPERIGALVLTPCDAFEHFLPWQFKGLQLLPRIPGATALTAKALGSARLRRGPLGFGLLTKHGIPDDVTAGYVEPLRRDAEVRRDLDKALKGIDKRYTVEAAKLLPRFDKPALIVWAREEKVFPEEDARKLAERLPDSRLEFLDDCWTYIPEDQPEKLAALIREFVSAPASREAQPGASAPRS
jgi:pimeloyl-ACP methyl ester carboxylesterase